jgi:ferredoxin
VFAVATYGGMPGAATGQLARILQQNRLRLSAGFTVAMPGNCTPLYDVFPPEKQQQLFARAKAKIKTIAAAVRAGTPRRLEKSFFLYTWFFSGILYSLSTLHVRGMDKAFWLGGKCTSCGICEKVCPSWNITLQNGKPVWHGRCEQCLACLHWCPTAAIEHGNKTKGRARYRHPDITVEEMQFR